jgi:tetratricopeptide (TPR) repeat protein
LTPWLLVWRGGGMSEQPPRPTRAEIIALVQEAVETGAHAREVMDVLDAMSPDERQDLMTAFGVRPPRFEDYYEEKPGRFELRWPLLARSPLPRPFDDLDRRTQFALLFGDWWTRAREVQDALTRGDVAEAESICAECVERALQLDVGALLALSFEGHLQVAEKRGDLDARRAWLSKTLEAAAAAGLPTLSWSRRAAMLELEAGRPQEAERQLTALIETLGEAGDAAELLQHGGCYLDRAGVRRIENRWTEALKDIEAAERLAAGLPELRRADLLAPVYFQRAQIQSTPFSPAHDPAAAAVCCSRLRALGTLTIAADLVETTIAFDAEDWPRAASLAIEAARALETTGWRQGSARCRLMAAEALLEAGDLAAARAQLEPALDLFERHGPPAQLAQARLVAARSSSAAGDHETAWDLTVAALDGFDSLIRHFRILEDQQRFVADKLRRYDQAFDVAVAAPGARGIVRAWEVAERSKSFYLSQLVSSQRIEVFDGVPADDVRRLTDLELRLGYAEKDGGPVPSPPAAKLIQDLSEQRQSLLTEMMRANPRWAAVRTPPRLDLEAELSKLAPEWAPISYYWRADGSGGAALHIFHLDGAGSPRRIEVAWSKRQVDDVAAAGERLASLSGAVDLLLPGALATRVLPATLREAIRPGARLLISPHGALRRLPLHALGDPLIACCPVQYIPSLSLRALRRPRLEVEDVLLLGCVEDGWNDPRLKSVPQEIGDLAGVWGDRRPGKVRDRLLGPEDSPESANLPVDRWHGFDVIHCACHGEFPPDRPFDAALRLGGAAVRSSTFFGVRLNARLVSLSACSLGGQAAVGEVVGDEWLGLYLPLLYAGAEHLVVSLWPADGRMAVRCMVGLHERVAAGRRPADALREAIVAVGPKTWASKWANWFLVGVD